MSSSEEYLDNLLKALLENESSAGGGSPTDEPESPEELFASMSDVSEEFRDLQKNDAVEDQQSDSAAAESNKAMSTDEIEEMLSSMNGSIVAENPTESNQPVTDIPETEHIVEADKYTAQETPPDEAEDLYGQSMPDDFAVDEMAEDSMKEESENDSDLDAWALEEEPVTEDAEGSLDAWALEEPVTEDAEGNLDAWALEEEPVIEETEGNLDTWALEEPVTENAEGTLDAWALEEEPVTEETEGSLDAWALEEEPLTEETAEPLDAWALEEEPVTEETENVLDEWVLEKEPFSGEEEPEDNMDEWVSEEGTFTEETEPDPEMDGWVAEEEPFTEETEPEPIADKWVLEEEPFTEETEPEPIADEWVPEEETFAEETEPERATDEWAFEKELFDGEAEPERVTDGWAFEEGLFDGEAEPENGIDEWALEKKLILEEMKAEEQPEGTLSEWGMEEEMFPEEPKTETEPESTLGEWGLEDESSTNGHDTENVPDAWGLGEEGKTEEESMPKEEPVPEAWTLEEEILPELPVLGEETVRNELTMEDEDILGDLMSEDKELSEGAASGGDMPDDDLSMDLESSGSIPEDFGMENEDLTMGSTMSEEDIDRLLGDDFALEESGEGDEGLSDLLAGMEHDEDLSEINDLLEKADRGLMEDDDMLALLGSPLEGDSEGNNDEFDFWGQEDTADAGVQEIQEIVSGDSEEEVSMNKEKKKDRKGKKDGKKNAQSASGKAGSEEKQKKKGLFGKLFDMLMESDDDFADNAAGGEDGAYLGTLSDENRELLGELDAEDKKKANKKDKKKKAKKDKKESKKPKEKKAKKPKKPKKEKKPKAEVPTVPEKKISRTKIIFVILFCSSVAACIIVVNMFIPEYMQKQEAREMYADSQYERVYDLLYGKELNEEEEAMLQRSNIILQIRQKLDFYENYDKLGMDAEALNALLEGVERYQMLWADAQQYGVTSEVDSIYAQILAELSGNYGVSEEDAWDILASEDDLSYSEKVYGIINGTPVGGSDSVEEEQPEVKQDILPEEEEIIDRLENSDDTAETPENDL